MEEADRAPLERRWHTSEPVIVRALRRLGEQLDQPFVDRASEMAVEHEGNPESSSRGIEDELACVEIIDVRRLELGHPDGLAPDVEHLRHLAMEEDRHALQVRRLSDTGKLTRADCGDAPLSQ